MAKSIRSKIKRKHRTEFRQTIGEEAAKKQMEETQAKLQQCIQSGTNIFESMQKLSDQMYGTGDGSGDATKDEKMEGKSENKIPLRSRRKEKEFQRYRKKAIRAIAGTDAARLARKAISKAKRRGEYAKGKFVEKTSERKERAPRKNRLAMST